MLDLPKLHGTVQTIYEDLRRLYDRVSVDDNSDTNRRFISLVNRLDPFLPEEREILDNSDPSKPYGVPEIGNGLKDAAKLLVKKFDDRRIPPPFWLRVLPYCLEIGKHMQENGKRCPALGFLSVAVEDPFAFDPDEFATSPENSYCALLNRSQNVKSVDFGTAENGERVRVFAKIFYHLDELRSQSAESDTAVNWGIRFRSYDRDVDSGTQPADHSGGPWCELVVDESGKRIAHVRFPDDTPEVNRGRIRTCILRWLLGNAKYELEDFPGLIQSDMVGPQIQGYISAIKERMFEDSSECGQDMQFDTLIVPCEYWSPNQTLAGSSASIFWAFDNHLENQDLHELYLVSTKLLSGVGQLGKLSELIDALAKENDELRDLITAVKVVKPKLELITQHARDISGWVNEIETLFYDPSIGIFGFAADFKPYIVDKALRISETEEVTLRHNLEYADQDHDARWVLMYFLSDVFRLGVSSEMFHDSTQLDAYFDYRFSRLISSELGKEDKAVLSDIALLCAFDTDGTLSQQITSSPSTLLARLKNVLHSTFKPETHWLLDPFILMVKALIQHGIAGSGMSAQLDSLNKPKELLNATAKVLSIRHNDEQIDLPDALKSGRRLMVQKASPFQCNTIISVLLEVCQVLANEIHGPDPGENIVKSMQIHSWSDKERTEIKLKFCGAHDMSAGDAKKLRRRIAVAVGNSHSQSIYDSAAGNLTNPFKKLVDIFHDSAGNTILNPEESWSVCTQFESESPRVVRLLQFKYPQSKHRGLLVSFLFSERDRLDALTLEFCNK